MRDRGERIRHVENRKLKDKRARQGMDEEDAMREEYRKRAITALNDAERVEQPHPKHLFTDVFDELPPHLQEQQAELKAHLQKYGSSYPELSAETINTL